MTHYFRILAALALILLSDHKTYGQYVDDFVPGSIISLNNDTIPGFVKIKGEDNVSLKKLRFKENEGEKVTVYSPNDVNGFIIGDFLFLSRTTRFGKDFWLLIDDGPVRIFERRKSFYNAEYIRQGIIGTSSETYVRTGRKIPDPNRGDEVFKMIQKKSGGPTIAYNIEDKKIDNKLKKELADFFKDSPEISHNILISEYGTSDILLMVYCYNEPGKYKLLPLTRKKPE